LSLAPTTPPILPQHQTSDTDEGEGNHIANPK
jgi:hypothetical protein